MSDMKLRFKESEISHIAESYKYPRKETQLLELREAVQREGFLNKSQLKLIAQWKAPRSAGHVEKNAQDYIREITGYAFKARDERSRIELLTLLDGVAWPTASVILHLFHADPYPILDFRALWSVNLAVPKQYGFSFWWPYVEYCRKVAARNRVNMRILDRAMWQYSKKYQKKSNV